MLRITGGKVYDPANGIDGVVKDLCIDDAGHFALLTHGPELVAALKAAGA